MIAHSADARRTRLLAPNGRTEADWIQAERRRGREEAREYLTISSQQEHALNGSSACPVSYLLLIPPTPILFPNAALLFTMLLVLSAGFSLRPLRSLSTHTPSPTTSAAIFTIPRRGIGIRREFRSSDYKRMMRSPLITIEANPGFAPSHRNTMIPD